MLAVSSRVGQSIHIHSPDFSLFTQTHPDRHLHFMAGRGGYHGLISCIYHFSRASGLHRDDGRIDFRHPGLFRSESPSDSRLNDADGRFRYAKGIRQDSSYVERDLGRSHHIQPAKCIQIRKCPECFHHGLVIGFCMVCPLNHQITVF